MGSGKKRVEKFLLVLNVFFLGTESQKGSNTFAKGGFRVRVTCYFRFSGLDTELAAKKRKTLNKSQNHSSTLWSFPQR